MIAAINFAGWAAVGALIGHSLITAADIITHRLKGTRPMKRPVNRCATRGCPMLGYWLEGDYCPEHRLDEPARPPMPFERDEAGQW
jgi:hypothetical protein